MIKEIYCVYDRLAGQYMTLTEFANDAVAVRAFREALKTVPGFKDHPEDLEIHRIGNFEDQCGTFNMDKEILEKGEKHEV